MADDIAAEDQIVVIAANHDAGKSGVSLCRHAVVKQLIVLEYVAVGAHRLGLVAEKDAGLAVADNGVVAEKVVAVLVPDRDAVALVAAEFVLLEDAVLDPPTDVEPVLIVVEGAVAAHDGVLRAAARVEAEPAVLFNQAIFNRHVLGYLETDAVSLVVADHTVANPNGVALEQIDAASPAAVEILRAGAIPLDRQTLERDVLDTPAAHDGKGELSGGLVGNEIVEVERLREPEGIGADAGGQGRGGNGKAAAGAFVLDGHAIAEPKTGGILDRDLPLVGVPVRDQVGLETITGGQDRLARFTDQADVGAQS